MSADESFEDIWTLQSSAPDTPATPALDIQTIDDVEPLDDQFGVDPPKTVPDALYEPLFGQSEPTEDDASKAAPLHTYAILDAAKITGLAELLEASGLEHRCLFKGDAYNDMKDLAPWIVRLEDGNGFTRNLFTRSDAPWHLWDAEPGIYVRSLGTLDDMWRHFRKFTKLQDVVEGIWSVLRLHASGVPTVALLGTNCSDTQAASLAAAGFRYAILILDGDDAGRLAAPEAVHVLSQHVYVKTIVLPDGVKPDTMDEDLVSRLVR